MEELQVGLGERSYPIHIGSGNMVDVGRDLSARQIAGRYAVVADDRVVELYGRELTESFSSAGLKMQFFPFPHGEASKTLPTFTQIISELAKAGFDRKDAIVGFGGGVSGDLAGFLAASYMRGVPFVQIPTTLLAQVDSSVGGKTGVDIPEGKNLVGAFYQPKSVYIDISVLQTLPQVELLGGLAEVIKYGVIWDRTFFDFLKENRDAVLALNPKTVIGVVTKCCTIKAEVVAKDEKEGDLRRILNFGHTIGHAVEAVSRFSLIHGLAVSIGMVAASRLSVLKGLLSEQEASEIVELLEYYGLPTEIPPEFDREEIKRFLLSDKKTVAGKVFFVLPITIGKTVITSDVTDEQIDEVLG